MSISRQNLRKLISLIDPQPTFQERRQQHSKWRIMTGGQRLNYLHKELHSIILTLLSKKVLNEQKLSKVLALNVTLDEAMAFKLPNFYAYIMHLIRTKTSNTARTFLNQLTQHINKYEDLLHKQIQKEVQRYRKLDESTDKNSEISERENLGKDYQRSYVQGRQKIQHQAFICSQQGSTRPLYFSRITKGINDR